MLQIIDVAKSYGEQRLFDKINFTVNPGERIGLVGRNGHGKTTLFRLILGEEHPDAGKIEYPSDYRIGHLSQRIQFVKNTVLEEGCLSLPKNEDGWNETYKVEQVLQGLGFDTHDLVKDPMQLSGGFQVRLNLAKLLVSEPNLLLLDEPTNYLDIVSLRWLITFLRAWPHELMLITHDRFLMDQISTHTVAIHRQSARKMQGSTSKLFAQIQVEEEIHENTRQRQEKKRQKIEAFARRFRAKATKASAVQSKLKQLEKLDELEKLEEIPTLHFQFNAADFPGKQLLETEGLGFRYADDTPWLIRDLNFAVQKHDRIGIIGKNGKGKTTLLNLIADELRPSCGKIKKSGNVKFAYFGQTNVERLHLAHTIEEEIMLVEPDHNRRIARGICGHMMFEGDTALKQINVLSGGEKSRVLLGKILVTPANLLLLDEPTNHLDMQATEALLYAIKKFPGAILLVTHNERILFEVANKLIILDGGKATFFDGGYEDFLERVGWKDEEPVAPPKNTSGINKKDLRKKRAEIITERSRVLNPLKKRAQALEEEIVQLEQVIKQEDDELLKITRDGFGERAAQLSRSVRENRKKVELLFAALEEIAQKVEMLSQQFETDLKNNS